MPVVPGDTITTEFTGSTRGLDNAFRYVERETGRHLTKVENLYRDATGRLVAAQNAMAVKSGKGGGLLSGLGGRLETAVIGGVSGFIGGTLSNTILDAGKALVSYNATMEQTRIGFTTLLGSADAAGAHLKELEQFAAKTPFEFEDLTRASRRFLNMGLNAKQVIPIMQAVGDAVAAAGGNGETIDRVTTAIAQMSAKGKVSAEEINQLAEAGVGGWKILSDQLGKTNAEVIKLAEDGQISANVFIEAFRRFSETNFGGAMEKQSNTFLGAWSTIMDTLKMQGGKAFEPLFDSMSSVLVRVKDGMEGLDLEDGLEKAITGAGEASGRAAYELGLYIGRQVKQGIADGRRTINDPVLQFSQGAALGIVEEIFGSDFDLTKIPSLAPQSLTPDPMALNSTKVWLDGVSDAAKKAGDILGGLKGQIDLFNDSSNEASTRQKLFAAGLIDTTNAIYQQAVGMAQLLDRLQQIKEETAEAGRRQLEETHKRIDIQGRLAERLRAAEFEAMGDNSRVAQYTHWLQEMGKSANDANSAIQATFRILRQQDEKDAADKAEKKRANSVEGMLGSLKQLGEGVERDLLPKNLGQVELAIRGIDKALAEFSLGDFTDQMEGLRGLALDSVSGDIADQARSLSVLQSVIETMLTKSNSQLGKKDANRLKPDEVHSYSSVIARLIQQSAQLQKQMGETAHAEAYEKLLGDISGQLETNIPVTVRMRLEQALLTDATKSLGDAEKERLRGLADTVDRQNTATRAAEETRRQMQEVARDLSGIFMNAQEGLEEGGIRGALSSLGRDASDTLHMIERELLNSALLSILDPDAAAKGSQAGGVVGALTNKILQAIGVMPQSSQNTTASNTATVAINTDATVQNTVATQQLTMALQSMAMGAAAGAGGGGGFWSSLLSGAVSGLLGGIGIPGLGGLFSPGGSTSVSFDPSTIVPLGSGPFGNLGIPGLTGYSGGRAMGGPVDPLQMYKINEHENEWLYMGEKGGYMLNQRQMAQVVSSQATNRTVNLTVNFNDRSQVPMSRQTQSQVARGLLAALEHEQRRSNGA